MILYIFVLILLALAAYFFSTKKGEDLKPAPLEKKEEEVKVVEPKKEPAGVGFKQLKS